MASHYTVQALHVAWNALREEWHTAQGAWDDRVRREFEREYWEEFEVLIPEGLEMSAELLDLVEAAHAEVGE